MRKLKLQVQMSVDGFISGPHGEAAVEFKRRLYSHQKI